MRPSPLGALETAVMEHLWTQGSGDVKSVHAALKARRITVNTIQSTLRRLYDKLLLQRDKISHAHVYSPRLTRQEYQRTGRRPRSVGTRGRSEMSEFVNQDEDLGRKSSAIKGLAKSASYCFEDAPTSG